MKIVSKLIKLWKWWKTRRKSYWRPDAAYLYERLRLGLILINRSDINKINYWKKVFEITAIVWLTQDSITEIKHFPLIIINNPKFLCKLLKYHYSRIRDLSRHVKLHTYTLLPYISGCYMLFNNSVSHMLL